MHQVNEMVNNMRKHGRTSEIGIVMSGWHVVAVAVDGFQVRQSPVLDLHDGKELKDGILLLMHLLSPIFTTAKAPWRKESLVNHPNVASTLPEDIIQQIIHFTDLDTYSILSLVSRYFRSIYLAYPRVGHYILLGYGATANTESKYKGAVFKVRNTDSTSSTLARLMRTASCIDNRLPLWSYRAKCYLRCILRPGLAGTFQHLQLGTGPLDHTSSENGGPPRGRVLFRDVIRGDKHPEMRI
ncbi:hypothetical protein B0J17DRAFT_719466 [Rhizoctonia solani]|nr:hypothetical protein B0J17DRAFT_719466 [Rhizoctonia solani]